MKTQVQVIRAYDRSVFEKQLSEVYASKDVVNVDTHTESYFNGRDLVIYYIAIVFYKENVGEIALVDRSKSDVLVSNLGLNSRAYGVLVRHNRHMTLGDLVDLIRSGSIYKMKNIGGITVTQIKERLVELGLVKEDSSNGKDRRS